MPAGIIGLVLGGGEIPFHVISELKRTGARFVVAALEGFAEKKYITDDVTHIWIRLGNAGRGVDFFKKHGVTKILMVGSVSRPSFSSLIPDAFTARIIAKVGFKAFGDDGILKLVAKELETEGFKIIAVQDILGGIIAAGGVYGRSAPDDRALADIRHGVKILKAISDLDIGQGVVVQQGLVLGIEAIEGTDGLLERVKNLKREGAGGVLIKMKKTGQSEKLDLPTIGPDTVLKAHAAGLRGIAIHAGNSLVVGSLDVLEKADEKGLFIYGYKDDGF